MYKALKQQLLVGVEDICIRPLKERYVKYGNPMCLKVIDHIKKNYYNITPVYLKLNTAHMNVPHNINKPSESSIEQIETAVDFTDAVKIL